MKKYINLINILDKIIHTNYKFILISKINPNIKKIIHYKLDYFVDDWTYNIIKWDSVIKL